MRRVGGLLRILLVALVVSMSMAGDGVLLAQAPNNQQRYQEAIRSAQQAELLGYILAGAGIVMVLAGIPLAIYWDRKKKARKQAAQQELDARRSAYPEQPHR